MIGERVQNQALIRRGPKADIPTVSAFRLKRTQPCGNLRYRICGRPHARAIC